MGLFSRFSSKGSAKADPKAGGESLEAPEIARTLLGQAVGRYVNSAFQGPADRLIAELRHGIETAGEQSAMPPLQRARALDAEFVKRTHQLRADVKAKALQDTQKLHAFSVENGLGAAFAQFLDQHIEERTKDLVMAGLELLVDAAHDLKVADNYWRTEHPELAARFPVVT
ncbi:MAG: hypothetical protein U1E62_07765 [Alsobacter sp.]